MSTPIRARSHRASLAALFAIGLFLTVHGSSGGASGAARFVARSLGAASLTFEVNQGQTDPRVSLLSRGAGYALFLTDEGATLRLPSGSRSAAAGVVLGMRLEGAREAAAPRPEVEAPLRSHYFLGSDRRGWRSEVRHYSRARYAGVYPGIDLVYYGNQRQLEYDFVLQPGADPRQIRMSFDGAEGLEVDAAGDLLIRTPQGTLRQHRPLIYQEAAGRRDRVDGRYLLAQAGDAGGVSVGFDVPSFDASRPLVIDPVLSYASYVGGAGDDYGNDIAVGPDGNAWVTGHTTSAAFPGAGATHRVTGGGTDAFVARVSPAGALLSITYLGGAGDDRGHQVAVDPAGAAYVAGETASGNFPTAAALQGAFGGVIDGFLTKLSASGSALVYSTYLGGQGDDRANALWVSDTGVAYLTGLTTSTDFPVTAGAMNGALHSASADAFVTAVGAAGNALVFSTYLGGVEEDIGMGIAADANGSVYVAGDTASANFPITPGAYQPTPGGGLRDAFVVKLNPGGASLAYSTFVGGNGLDRSAGLAVDSKGNAYVAGFTNSTSFPTVNAPQPEFGGGLGDGFVSMVNASGTGLVYSTYLGGSERDTGQGVVVEADGTAAVTGLTASGDFPTTANALHPDPLGGGSDAYVVRIAPGGLQLSYATHLGGAAGDLGLGIAVDARDDLYVCGATGSQNLGAGGFVGGQVDAFAMRLASQQLPAPTNLQLSVISGCQIDLSWVDHSTGEDAFQIERKTGSGAFSVVGAAGGNQTTYSDVDLSPLTTYTYRARATSDEAVSDASNEASANTPVGPAAPGSLAATAVSRTRIDLTWVDNANDETGFTIERSTNGGISFATRGNVASNVTTFADTGLAGGTTYTYRVRTLVAGGCSAASNDASATTPPDPPAAPTSLFAVAGGPAVVDLYWEDGSFNESGFRIERAVGAGSFSQIHVTGPNAVTHQDTGLAAGTEYRYRLRATNSGGDSAYTSIASATTADGLPAPPSQLAAAAISNSRIDLAWTDGSANETSFRIERRVGTAAFAQVGQVAANATTYSDEGLDADTTYEYRVRAANALGLSDPSNVSGATTSTNAPTAPASLAAVATGRTSIQLGWQDKSGDETGFRIERRTGMGAFAPIGNAAANALTFADSGLSGETSYTYRVFAFNANGDSAASNEAAATTGLNPPTGLSIATLSQTELRLTWTDGSALETATRIERSADGVSFVEIASTGADATSFTDSGLLANTTYHYRIRHSAGGPHSEYTDPETGTTLPNPPGAPFALTVAAEGQHTLRVSWLDGSTNETGFVLERSEGGGGFMPAAMTGANVLTHLDTGLAADTTYTYRVKARNTGGDSAYATPQSGTTLPIPPAAPSGLTAALTGVGEATLTWTDESDNEASFSIERSAGAGAFALRSTVGADVGMFVDGGLQPNTLYTYRVCASNAGGDSSFSGAATVTTLAAIPPSPQALVASVRSASTIHLSWTDASGGQAEFRILRKEMGAVSAGVLGTAPANATSYQDTAATAGVTYVYSVVAFNSGGDSGPSNEATAAIPTGGILSLPRSSNFGTRRVGQPRVRTIRIRNRGRGELAGYVDAGSIGAPFRVLEGAGGFSLARRQSKIIRVEFAPAVAGPALAALVVTSTDPRRSRSEVALKGKGR